MQYASHFNAQEKHDSLKSVLITSTKRAFETMEVHSVGC